jgi:hypothetical protein
MTRSRTCSRGSLLALGLLLSLVGCQSTRPAPTAGDPQTSTGAAPAASSSPSSDYPMVAADRGSLELGVELLADIDTTLRLDDFLRGSTIDAESDLGLDDRMSTFRADGHFRVRPRHKLEASFFQINRSGSAVLTQPIIINDIIIPISVPTDTELDLTLLKAAYRYSFYQSEQAEVGLGLGVQGIDLQLEVDAVGLPVVDIDAIIPVPVVGLNGA